MTGSAPTNLHYTGWKIHRRIRDVTDGLSNTLMIGEKHVHQADMGHAQRGDGAFHNDDKHSTSARVAGPGFPIARGPEDVLFGDAIMGVFGSAHPGGICQFVLGDGSVREIKPDTSTIVLGHLANIHDGHVIPRF